MGQIRQVPWHGSGFHCRVYFIYKVETVYPIPWGDGYTIVVPVVPEDYICFYIVDLVEIYTKHRLVNFKVFSFWGKEIEVQKDPRAQNYLIPYYMKVKPLRVGNGFVGFYVYYNRKT
jgi:hypothetical protein